MTQKSLQTIILSCILFAGCSNIDVSVDYDQTYNFSNVKTFSINETFKESEDTLFNDRVVNALKNELNSKNYSLVPKDSANLIFVFYANLKDKTMIYADSSIYGYRGYRYGGMMMSSTYTYEYTEGTLVIDALNPKTKKIIWRGIGVKEITKNKTPQEKIEAINKAVKEIMDKFPTSQLWTKIKLLKANK